MGIYEDKLDKLEKKIEKRKSTIASENEKLRQELEEYDRICVMALAEKYNLKGRDLFNAIEREHEELEKYRDKNSVKEDVPENNILPGQTTLF